MLTSFLATDEEGSVDKTGIDWLDVAIALASILVAHWIKEIEITKVGRVGNAAVLKTDDTET